MRIEEALEHNFDQWVAEVRKNCKQQLRSSRPLFRGVHGMNTTFGRKNLMLSERKPKDTTVMGTALYNTVFGLVHDIYSVRTDKVIFTSPSITGLSKYGTPAYVFFPDDAKLVVSWRTDTLGTVTGLDRAFVDWMVSANRGELGEELQKQADSFRRHNMVEGVEDAVDESSPWHEFFLKFMEWERTNPGNYIQEIEETEIVPISKLDYVARKRPYSEVAVINIDKYYYINDMAAGAFAVPGFESASIGDWEELLLLLRDG